VYLLPGNLTNDSQRSLSAAETEIPAMALINDGHPVTSLEIARICIYPCRRYTWPGRRLYGLRCK